MGVSRVSFASAEETREVTGMMLGGVTALALPQGLPVYADMRLLDMDYIILSSLGMAWDEIAFLAGESRWSCPAVARAPLQGVSVRRQYFS